MPLNSMMGILEPGNIDLTHRPRVRNPDGSISTVRSIGVNFDGQEVLIPTVSDDGRVMSDDEAIAMYRQTGRHLGKFEDPEAANAYAEWLHGQQEQMYTDGPPHTPGWKDLAGLLDKAADATLNPESRMSAMTLFDALADKIGPYMKPAALNTLPDVLRPIGSAVWDKAKYYSRNPYEAASDATEAAWNIGPGQVLEGSRQIYEGVTGTGQGEKWSPLQRGAKTIEGALNIGMGGIPGVDDLMTPMTMAAIPVVGKALKKKVAKELVPSPEDAVTSTYRELVERVMGEKTAPTTIETTSGPRLQKDVDADTAAQLRRDLEARKTAVPAPGAPASALTKDHLLNGETLGEVEQRVLDGNSGIRAELGKILQARIEREGPEGFNTFQDWMNPEKVGSRIRMELTQRGMSHRDAMNTIGPLVKQYEAKYKEVVENYGKQKYQELVETATGKVEAFAGLPPDKVRELEAGKKVKAYRAMQLIDGKLYPPMSAKIEGKLRKPTEIGQWEMAEERPDLATGDGYFKLDKGNKKSIKARYNPYFHVSKSPLNDQFSEAHKRSNLVTVEVEIPESELTSGYRAEKAKDAVGEMKWHSGPVSNKLPKDKQRTVILSRYAKVTRIVPDDEVADHIANTLKGENIPIPKKVLTPSLQEKLAKRGVTLKAALPFAVGGAAAGSAMRGEDNGKTEYQQLLERLGVQ